MLLLDHSHIPGGAGHDQLSRPHRQVLAQRFRISIDVKDANRPEVPMKDEIFADEIKEMDRILQGGQHIGDQGQDVRDCNLISSMEATAYDAACSFNNP